MTGQPAVPIIPTPSRSPPLLDLHPPLMATNLTGGTGIDSREITALTCPASPELAATVNFPAASGDSLLVVTGPFETSTTQTPFIPTLGAWTKPLHFTPAATPPEPSTPCNSGGSFHGDQETSIWPTLKEGLREGIRNHKIGARKLMPNLPVDKLPPPLLKVDGSLRFPWASKMNPTSRNLFRAADPTYRIDGTPQVTIPRKVLLLGPENHDEYVIGNFFRCSAPSGGLVHAVVNRLWGRSCKVTSRKVGYSTFMFHIPHDGTRSWVLQRGLWHIDDCLLFVAPWSPAATFDVQEISTIPVWVNLTKIPDRLYSRLGISHIASGLGEPMMTHKPHLDPTLMGEAKVMVEVELDKPFPKKIALDDKQGNIFLVDVHYTWIPSVCDRCGQLGHKEKRCLLSATATTNVKHSKKDDIEQENVPVVDVHHLLDQSAQVVTSHINPTPPSSNTLEALDSQSQLAALLHPEQLTTYKSHVQDTTTVEVTPTAHSSQQVEVTPTLFSSHITPLAASASAPKHTTTMESPPSTTSASENIIPEADPSSVIINLCHPTPSHDSREDILPYDCDVDGEMESEPICHSTLGACSKMTRGGRPIKTTQKVQEMEWSVVGRGNRGRRGRETNINPN